MKTENVMDLTKKAHKEGWKNLRGQQLMTIEESEEKTTEKFKDDIDTYQKCKEQCGELVEALQEAYDELRFHNWHNSTTGNKINALLYEIKNK